MVWYFLFLIEFKNLKRITWKGDSEQDRDFLFSLDVFNPFNQAYFL